MRLFACTALFLATLAAAAQKTPTDKRLANLDAAFNRILADWHAAGFAVAVVEKNKVIYQKGFGYRDVERKLPVTPNTLFAIGSCTKAFTAALIGKLQQEGKVDFDKPAHVYLPSLSFYNDAMNNSITLRDMMSHRTGLPRHDFSWYFFNTGSRDSLLERIHYQEPNAGVRDKWQYNNFMYLAQGAIAEKLTGKTWEQNIKEKFFVPLGMRQSNFSIAELQQAGEAATGYRLKNDSIIKRVRYYNINAMAPAGSINSNVAEMTAWLRLWINNGKWDTTEILSSAYTSQAITPQAIVSPGLPTKERPDVYFFTYGLGWFLSSYRGHYLVEHGGNIDGFSASTCFFPTDSIGIVVLTNQDNSVVPSIVRNIISDRMLNLKPYDWNADLKNEVAKRKANDKEAEKNKTAPTKAASKPTHPLKDYEGAYLQPGYGIITVFLKGDSLFARTPEHMLWLKHDNYDVFDFFEVKPDEDIDTTGSGSARIQFLLNKTGNVESLSIDLESSLKPLVFTRQLQQQEVTKTDLQKYIGEYQVGNLPPAKVYIKGEKTLYLFVPGQPEYELLPLGSDKFENKTLRGYFMQFIVDDKGVVSGATYMEPSGNYKAVKK